MGLTVVEWVTALLSVRPVVVEAGELVALVRSWIRARSRPEPTTSGDDPDL
ncbi:MAG TPA: hypothetical protein VNO31_37840 [Umezawaea sp.]|nr:hypothetical protein [Umezawaea sp.]